MAVDDLRKQVKALQADIADMKAKDVSLDLVPVLAIVLQMFTNRLTLEMAKSAVTMRGIHGHGLVMLVLCDLEKREPGILQNKTLYEIGTTRERHPGQGSSEKLAIFCAIMGMKFITIDMDPKNTARIRPLLPLINPNAGAFPYKGEVYFANNPGPYDFVYLDSFDFNHGRHSEARQERYRANMGVDILDELCWKSHLECAKAMAPKMPAGGIVIVDDTLSLSDGSYDRKGKLAVPYLLANGYELLINTANSVALRKIAA